MERLQSQTTFSETIPQKQWLTTQQAIDQLQSATVTNEKTAQLIELLQHFEGSCVFVRANSEQGPCIVLEAYHPEGVWAFNALLDQETGAVTRSPILVQN